MTSDVIVIFHVYFCSYGLYLSILCIGTCVFYFLCSHCCRFLVVFLFFFFKQKTAYEMRISDWSSDVCSSDLLGEQGVGERSLTRAGAASDEDVLPIDDGEAQQPGRVGRHDAVVHIVDQRVNFGRRLADRETGREADRWQRSEERGVGKEWVSSGRSRWSPYH